MASISSTGIGSGLNVDDLVSKLMAVERLPATALDTKEAAQQAKLSAFGTLKSSLAALQTAARAVATPAAMAPLKTSVTTGSVLNASAGASAAAGTYNIEVQSLAASQKLKTAVGYNTTSDVVGTGTITLNVGSYDNASPPVFTPNPSKAAKSITIDPGNNTLAGIRDAINGAGAGITASIINDGATNYLSLTSTETGVKNMMQISVSDPSLQALAYNRDPLTSDLEQTGAASDAVIKVDNVLITKSSNTITDAIQGVTLNLTDTTATGVTTKLSLTRDTASVQTAIENLVKAYNDSSKAMSDSTAYNTATGVAATLNGDSTVRWIQNALRSVLSGTIDGASSNASNLASIGVTTQRDGSLSIDSAKLTKALNDPTVDMSALLATNSKGRGYGAELDVVLGRILSPVGTLPQHTGTISTTIKHIGEQRDVLTARLAVIEKRYRAQFSALDTALARMQSTSSYLTQQLASITANS